MSFVAHSERLIVPPAQIVKYAQALSYKDFPKAVDILAIIRVESAFDIKAFNKEESKINPNRKLPPSRGLMQVQGGSFDAMINMQQGADRLREYYLLCKRNKECAVKSYNIGPSNYKKGKCKISAADYWVKYNKRKVEYAQYYKTINYKINIPY